ncbi:TetR/AcrR family transcriptional regulator [Bacillaceae bacterium CLA-AA-H227]|uniref:TetR/AcrR family transcriptional regulator n=1 Tax=Robertmurraya yapensis (ex Hitch et al 2024) TaxID=3133160 RepID=A0ACC6S607_9BACI
MSAKQDRRVERTKRDLKNSILHLIQEKQDLNRISITEIVEKANYNRGTFYAHYTDKVALLNEIMEEAIDGFIEAFRKPYHEKSMLDLHSMSATVIKIFDHVEQNASIYSLLFNNKIFPGFQQTLCYSLEKVFSKEIAFQDHAMEKINKDLYIRSQCFSIIGMLDLWIERNFEFSSKYMTSQLLEISNYKPINFKITKSKGQNESK